MDSIVAYFKTFNGLYFGKIGVSNALLMLTGLLFFLLYYLKRQEAAYVRFRIYFYCGLFFTAYGFLFDIYRLKALRPLLLFRMASFWFYRDLVLFVTLLPLYIDLIRDIVAILTRMINQRKR